MTIELTYHNIEFPENKIRKQIDFNLLDKFLPIFADEIKQFENHQERERKKKE